MKLLELHLNSRTFSISYVFDNLGDRTLLSSINESSDSNKSDKSDDGSDNEKSDKQKTVPTCDNSPGNPRNEKESIKEGWNPLNDIIEEQKEKKSSSENLNQTMPLPQDNSSQMMQLIPPQYYSHSNNPTDYQQHNYIFIVYNNNYSMCSIDNETLSEGYKNFFINFLL